MSEMSLVYWYVTDAASGRCRSGVLPPWRKGSLTH
ncbi:hypothetical protein RSAG8_10390, partial [Rhizoctonia solani AG-8 WAC10335]